MLDLAAAQNLLGSWWYDYDEGQFDTWANYFTGDARFTCRSDLGDTPLEHTFRADLTGRDAVLAWQVEHRKNSPYPLRHNATNVHLTHVDGDTASFRSYLFVTKIVDSAVTNVASGTVTGELRIDAGRPRLASMAVTLDFAESVPFVTARQPSRSV